MALDPSPNMLDSVRNRWNDFVDEHEHVRTITEYAKGAIPPVNFITIHYTYFIVLTLVLSLILWGSNAPHSQIGFADCFFLITSAITNTGLNTVDLSRLTTWQQVLIWLTFILGSAIWVSFWTVMARKHAFEKRFDSIVEAERESRKRRMAMRSKPLRQFFSFEKFKTSPAAVPGGGLSGLGTRIPTTVEEKDERGDNLNTMPIGGAPLRNARSAPEDPTYNNTGRSTPTIAGDVEGDLPSPGRNIQFLEPQTPRERPRSSIYDHGSPVVSADPRRPSTAHSAASNESEENFLMNWKQFLGKHNVNKRGQVFDLDSDARDALGGCEYRALKVLAVVVPAYGLLWQILSGIALGAWIAVNKPEAAAEYGANSWWAGIFLSGSAFNNAGMSIIDAGMGVFSGSYFVLIVVGVLIVAGNTGYPLFLRFILWIILKVLNVMSPTEYGPWRETIEFILKYPRRVYTTLFPSQATWWLVLVLVLINTIDWVAFEVLNIGNDAVEALPMTDRIFAGWFQAIGKYHCSHPLCITNIISAVRAAGFAVVSISSLYPAVQLLYMIMMYISVYPVSITMRHSNIYEERSLGIYEEDLTVKDDAESGLAISTSVGTEDPDPIKKSLRRRATAAVGNQVGKGVKRTMTFHGVGAGHKGPDDNSRVSFIHQQIRGQLAHDLWWLVVPLIVIVIIETDHFLDKPLPYSLFNILFEVVSGYACVGLSVGYPDANYSFSGAWHTGSKIVLCLVMLRGRHRGLPVALDKAVRLPGEHLQKEEAEDTKLKRAMTMDRMDRIASRSD